MNQRCMTIMSYRTQHFIRSSLRLLALAFILNLMISGTAHSQEGVVIIPMFEDDSFVGKFPNPVAPDQRSVLDFVSFNGVALDEVTNLLWQRQDDGVARTWSEAWEYCKGVRLINRSDWRLPTFHELLSIYDFVPYQPSDLGPTINESVFPNTKHNESGDEFNGEYWTATRDIQRQSIDRTGSWFFAMSFALNTDTEFNKYSFFRYRPIADNSFDSTAKAYTRCVI